MQYIAGMPPTIHQEDPMTHTTHATPSRMIILCRHETEHVPVLYDARIHGTTVRTYPDRASCQAACDRLNPRQGDQEDPMITIRQLNQQLRDR